MRIDPIFPADLAIAVYDLNSNTRTFDFAYFLVGAECHARLNGLDGFFLVVVEHDPAITSKRNDDYAHANKLTQRWREENIVRPLIDLCPACTGYAWLPMSEGLRAQLAGRVVYPRGYDGEHIPGLDQADVCALANQLGDFVGLRASPLATTLIDRWRTAAGVHRELVTITLRQYPYDPPRNSNLPEWLRFARVVRDRGYEPIIVPDNYRLFDHDDYGGCVTFREGALHLDLRTALYERALINFFVPNGPTALALLNRQANYVLTKLLVPESRDSNAEALAGRGTEIGKRSYFDVPTDRYQVLSWRDDAFDEILHEFELFERHFGVRVRA
jgi:hypothetical protein